MSTAKQISGESAVNKGVNPVLPPAGSLKEHTIFSRCKPQPLRFACVRHFIKGAKQIAFVTALRYVRRDEGRGDGAVSDGLREVLPEQRAGGADGQGVNGQEIRARFPRSGRRELRL